jgi:hypothetical protein
MEEDCIGGQGPQQIVPEKNKKKNIYGENVITSQNNRLNSIKLGGCFQLTHFPWLKSI